jgi:azurin
MRTSTDADPGKVNRIWFIPIQSGKSEVICGQLCGAGHSAMKALLDVKETAGEFESWEKEQSPIREKGFAAEAMKKLGGAAPAPAPGTATPAPTPAPANTPAPAPAAGEPAKVKVGVIPFQNKFDKAAFSVQAGQPVELLFENKADAQPHNFVLLKPGSKDAYGAFVEKLYLTDAQGVAAQQFAPAHSDVILKSSLLYIGKNELIKFKAPATTGDYPYVCSFPGHWRLKMEGVMTVTL